MATSCKGDSEESQPQPAELGLTAHKHTNGESCFIEDPSKREPGRLWCKEHGRYEDRCWECQPQLRDPNRPYCEEHGLYEDECFLCDPSRAKGGPTAAETRSAKPQATNSELFCNEHQVPEHECGICQPELAGTLPIGESLSVRLATERSAELAGITTGRPLQGEAASTIQLLGEVRFDGNRLARITPLASGVLTKINADVGQVVEANAVLAVVNAPEVAEAKADYLSARTDLQKWQTASKRQRQLFEDRIGSQRAMEEADASSKQAQVASRLARQRLLNLGFSSSALAKLRDSSSGLNLRAPFKGSVVSRTAVLGEAVDTSKALFEIADLSQMWVELSVPVEQAGSIREGTAITVSVRSLEGPPIEGHITWVSPLTDERTRMVSARGLLPNENQVLRHGMFANVSAEVTTHDQAVRLPASAVHQIDNLPFVFVQIEKDLFAARRVKVGKRLPTDEFLVLAGIETHDEIVMTGGFSIKSALLAERLGAGCTDD
jgi:cobalt-zinc-cadmium efflux system membrane fusion protein